MADLAAERPQAVGLGQIILNILARLGVVMLGVAMLGMAGIAMLGWV